MQEIIKVRVNPQYKGLFIFYKIGGLVGFGGVGHEKKKMASRGGHPKNIREKRGGGSGEIFQ